MTYYLLKPCRTTAAFISTLKTARRLDLATARRRLEAAGLKVEDLSVMLIVHTDPELTLYGSGKTLVKTPDEAAARLAIDRVYGALKLPGDGGRTGPRAKRASA